MTRPTRLLLLWFGLFLCVDALAGTSVAVVPFVCRTGSCSGGGELADTLATLLPGRGGFDVVERSRIDAALDELDFAMSGLVDNTASALRLGAIIGAELLVVGEVRELSARARSMSVYGVQTSSVAVRIEINVRVIETSTGRIRFGDIVTVEQVYPNSDDERQAATRATTDIARQIADRMSHAAPSQPVEVSPLEPVVIGFSGTPGGASLVVDGTMVGTIPTSVTLAAGPHKIVVDAPGYEPWSRMVTASPGAHFAVNLVVIPPKEPDIDIRIRHE